MYVHCALGYTGHDNMAFYPLVETHTGHVSSCDIEITHKWECCSSYVIEAQMTHTEAVQSFSSFSAERSG